MWLLFQLWLQHRIFKKIYSNPCLIQHPCNSFYSVIRHWFLFPFDHFLCVLHCAIRRQKFPPISGRIGQVSLYFGGNVMHLCKKGMSTRWHTLGLFLCRRRQNRYFASSLRYLLHRHPVQNEGKTRKIRPSLNLKCVRKSFKANYLFLNLLIFISNLFVNICGPLINHNLYNLILLWPRFLKKCC